MNKRFILSLTVVLSLVLLFGEAKTIDPYKKQKRDMRLTQVDLFDTEEQGSTMAMEVDDVDPLEVFKEGAINVDNKLADADFFNNFADDFDDSDIN